MTRLAIVFLRGGADGLSLLVPAGDPAYRAARPTQGLTPDAVLDIGVEGFAMHPRAERVAALFSAGSVAAVPAAGFEGQTRSHFQAQALLEAGGRTTTPSGWIGRHLAATAGERPAPFRAVAIGTVSLPPSLWGSGDALAVPDPSSLALGAIRPAGRGRGGYAVVSSPLAPPLEALASSWTPGGRDLPDTARSGALAALEVLGEMARDPIAAVDATAFGDGPGAAVFAAASAVLDADLGTEVVQIDLGGWDTHDAQGTADGAFAGLVSGLDAGIGALMDRHAGTGDGLVVLVMTEFGRRLAENASRGTDHGRGGLALVIGDGVAGGIKGDWPGLTDLDAGDVRAVNDLRAVQAEVATSALGAEGDALEALIPGASGRVPLRLFS